MDAPTQKSDKQTTAKLFMHGRSQAVRLPKEFRFEGTEVRVSKVGEKVILEPAEKPPFDVKARESKLDARGAPRRSSRLRRPIRGVKCEPGGSRSICSLDREPPGSLANPSVQLTHPTSGPSHSN